MSGLVRNALRLSGLKNLVSSSATVAIANKQICRSVWHMSQHSNKIGLASSAELLKPVKVCSDTCQCFQHTKAEKELVEFLAEEIVAEKQAKKFETIPSEIDGFSVSLDGANVTLVKTQDSEKITITFNVNHSVDTESDPEVEGNEKDDLDEMESKPNFTVDITRGKKVLEFSCSFNNERGASGADDSYDDCFGIDEVTMYEGERNDKVYAVAGEVIDGYLYDLLMNYLEEKGISNEFAEKLIDFSTAYEHSAYISLLEGLSQFTRGSK